MLYEFLGAIKTMTNLFIALFPQRVDLRSSATEICAITNIFPNNIISLLATLYLLRAFSYGRMKFVEKKLLCRV